MKIVFRWAVAVRVPLTVDDFDVAVAWSQAQQASGATGL